MIVALQYYDGDQERTMSLARLLADIEPVFRNDVTLALVCQPGTKSSGLTYATVSHCAQKFPVIRFESARGDHGHPKACTALWTGAMEYFYEHYPQEAVFTLDGNDAVPLHNNWIDLMKVEHARTLAAGLYITGTPYWLGGCPLHVNPNAVFQMKVMEVEPSLLVPPVYDGTLLTHFDIYHRQPMLTRAMLSTVVHTDWQGGGNKISLELLRERASRSIWLHGYKDAELYWATRRHLAGSPVVPELVRYDLAALRIDESMRARLRLTSL